MWNFQLMSFYVETLTLHRYNNFFSRVYSLTHGFNYGQITPIPWSIHIFIFMCEFSARILRIEFCKNTTDGWLIKQIMWCSHTTVLDPRIKLFLQLYLPCQELGQIMTDAKKMPELHIFSVGYFTHDRKVSNKNLSRGANLKKCVIKGDNWSIKGPIKNLYILNAEVVLIRTTSGFKIWRFRLGPLTFKIQSPKLALAPRLSGPFPP